MDAVHVPGDVLADRYRLERLLGRGGMGSVWRGRSLPLDIDVAIKVVACGALDGEAGERLLREARAAASLGHPSIVRVFDFGTTAQGEPFLVMELLEGGSLATLLHERRRLPAAAAVRLVLPVVSALVSAHARGIVHRDIKPDNIMVVPGEGDALVPKLVDFGIVKLQGSETAVTLTEKGTLIGSPDYMSPEQARGLVDVDAKTDIWSVCVVLYELITGVRPFAGPNHGAVLYAIFSETPKPIMALAAGDEVLWEIVARGLEKVAEKRWPDARALGQELAAWAAGHGVTTDAAGMSIAEQWLGRRSSLDLEAASAPTRAGPSIADVPTAVLTASTRPDLGDPEGRPRPPRPRRAPGIALAAALLALVAAVAFASVRRASRSPGGTAVSVAPAPADTHAPSAPASAASQSTPAPAASSSLATTASASAPVSPPPRPVRASPGRVPPRAGPSNRPAVLPPPDF